MLPWVSLSADAWVTCCFMISPVLFTNPGVLCYFGKAACLFMVDYWVLPWQYIYLRVPQRKIFFDIGDFIAPLVPIGLAAGRIGNFINDELWGRPTQLAWGIMFPHGGLISRHPSQLYEFFLEGIVLFTILWIYSSKPRPRKAVSGCFLFFYGLFRFFIEFFREPDAQFGFLAWDWLTMGQLLSLPMILVGMLFLFFAYYPRKTR